VRERRQEGGGALIPLTLVTQHPSVYPVRVLSVCMVLLPSPRPGRELSSVLFVSRSHQKQLRKQVNVTMDPVLFLSFFPF